MAGNAQNFYLLPPAIAVDGDFNKRPYLWDFNAAQIGVVLPTNYRDRNGVARTGFEVTVWSDKEIRYTSVLFDTADFPTVDAFMTYVFATIDPASETLQKYTGWSKYNLYRPVSPTVSILVNNQRIRLREYVPSQNVTNLYVDLGHTLQHDIFTVAGDQTKAKAYYYAGTFA